MQNQQCTLFHIEAKEEVACYICLEYNPCSRLLQHNIRYWCSSSHSKEQGADRRYLDLYCSSHSQVSPLHIPNHLNMGFHMSSGQGVPSHIYPLHNMHNHLWLRNIHYCCSSCHSKERGADRRYLDLYYSARNHLMPQRILHHLNTDFRMKPQGSDVDRMYLHYNIRSHFQPRHNLNRQSNDYHRKASLLRKCDFASCSLSIRL